MFQEGGDVNLWRRRYFKLQGFDLVAHNETTMKVRAKINLRKVVEVLYAGKEEDDDEKEAGEEEYFKEFSVLSTATKHKRSRIISETLLLNEGFRLRFSNNETIDFGCDTAPERMQWIKILEEIVLKNHYRRQPWVKLMLEQQGVQI
ncbi:unnamed protein product [Ambrosiozyma monospora]|uniref:Unnamed protein product n=1 Tax=Ambrosiozyma monospora TaxID=43982 RepID=A0A9W6YVW7_AMBMO|nr:unnamed protein product [Ambrosiozyma monospora]